MRRVGNITGGSEFLVAIAVAWSAWSGLAFAASTPQQAVPDGAARADYAGTDACLTCHEDKAESLKGTPHGRASNPRSPLAGDGCEACHGPANRDWLLDQDEQVNNATGYLHVLRAIGQADVRLSYDYSDSNNGYIHSGPRIDAMKTATPLTSADTARPCTAPLTSCFEPLPPITNTWQRAMVDVRYMFARNVGLGLGYWYERLSVSDYATIDLSPGTPRIDYLGEISTGYGNRPYKAGTGFVRVLFLF